MTVVRAPRAKVVTVSETVLLPGPGALLAPDWVPWQDRLRPGDLGVGDLLPAPPDDERLVSLVVLEGDDAVSDWFGGDADEGLLEPAGLLAPGRSRALSAIGRESASERWYASEHGPRTPLARAAPAHCVSCGFFVPLSGELGRLFGACANAYAPADERWWIWTCACGVAMGLFALWYVPRLKGARARAAARRATAAAEPGNGPGNEQGEPGNEQGPRVQSAPRDSGSNTVSSTDTPGRSTRS